MGATDVGVSLCVAVGDCIVGALEGEGVEDRYVGESERIAVVTSASVVSVADGIGDGASVVGSFVGICDGASVVVEAVGICDGVFVVGSFVGVCDGASVVGEAVGICDGASVVGSFDGACDGADDGAITGSDIPELLRILLCVTVDGKVELVIDGVDVSSSRATTSELVVIEET